jgi:hypothetical protein
MVILAALWVAAELGFRWFFLEPSIPDDDRAFRRVVQAQWPPGIPERRPVGHLRVLGLADAVGAMGETNNFHVLLAGLLQDSFHRPDLVNFSVQGYGLHDELKLLRQFGKRYEPTIVLHSIVVGNDFSISPGEMTRVGGILQRIDRGVRSYPPFQWYLAEWLKGRGMEREKLRMRNAQADPDLFDRRQFLAAERRRMELCRRVENPAATWAAVAELLDETFRESAGMPAVYAMVIHPCQFQVNEQLRNKLIEEFGIDAREYDWLQPQRFLAGFAEARGISVMDLQPLFEASEVGAGLYRPNNAHYSDLGNGFAALAIDEFVRGILGSSTAGTQ